MNWRRVFPLLLLVLLTGAAFVVFYGPDPSFIPTVAALLLIPAGIGALITHLSDPDGALSPMGCFVWPTVGICAAIAVVWLMAREGAICIAMILPLWIPAAVAGALVQHVNRRKRLKRDADPARFQAAAWLVAPLLLAWIEGELPQQWQARDVSRSLTIAAKQEAVWPALVKIDRIGPGEGRWTVTQDLLGVPRPLGATLVRDGSGLVRNARWERGIRFEEHITALEPGKRICWRFAFPDDSVQRETDRHIEPDGTFLKIDSGCYALEPLANGTTRVTLTTRYRMRTRLSGYFAAWGELLLGDVQSNVLSIVAGRAIR